MSTAAADPLVFEALLLTALEAGPAGIYGLTARARARQDHPALQHEHTVRAAVGRLTRERWVAVLTPGEQPRYQLTGLGEQRLLWHGQRGTLERG